MGGCAYRRRRVQVVTLVGIVACLILLVGCGMSAEQRRLQADFKKLLPAMEKFNADNGRPPTAEEGLMAFVRKPESPDIARTWNGPYLAENEILDQWNRPYFFGPLKKKDGSGTGWFMWSKGKDGESYTGDDLYDLENQAVIPPDEKNSRP